MSNNYHRWVPCILINWSIREFKFTSTKKIGSGPGNARNKGILKSNGKYIGFLDADDTYSENYIEEMYKNVIANDIVICPTHVYQNNGCQACNAMR